MIYLPTRCKHCGVPFMRPRVGGKPRQVCDGCRRERSRQYRLKWRADRQARLPALVNLICRRCGCDFVIPRPKNGRCRFYCDTCQVIEQRESAQTYRQYKLKPRKRMVENEQTTNHQP